MLAMLKFALGGAQAPVLDAVAPAPARETVNAWRAAPAHSAYWPQHELDSFILQMAGHGQCVHAAMMLGDIDYARERLAAAAAIDCPKLRALSVRLRAYFDHPPCACSVATH